MKYFKIIRTYVIKAEAEAEAFRLVTANPAQYLDSETVARTEYKKAQYKQNAGTATQE